MAGMAVARMTAYASHVAAVPGPVLPLLILAALGCVWLATRAWNQPTAPLCDCWALLAPDWPRHVRVIHDEPETAT